MEDLRGTVGGKGGGRDGVKRMIMSGGSLWKRSYLLSLWSQRIGCEELTILSEEKANLNTPRRKTYTVV